VNLRPRSSLLPLVFDDRLGHQLEFTQRTHEFVVRFFCCCTRGVDRRVVAVFGPHDSFGDVGICVAYGPVVVDVQLYLPHSPLALPPAFPALEGRMRPKSMSSADGPKPLSPLRQLCYEKTHHHFGREDGSLASSSWCSQNSWEFPSGNKTSNAV
jgi:hypothetical protein